MSIIIFETFYHAINTQDEYIQLSRLIDLLTWAPSCLVYSGMTYLMILEKLPILTNLKTFYYLGMEMNANVMHVKKK